MIAVQRLNNQEFIINADQIETIEATPDSVITLSNGKKQVVKNSIDDLIKKIIRYKQLCNTTVQVVDKRDEDLKKQGAVPNRPEK